MPLADDLRRQQQQQNPGWISTCKRVNLDPYFTAYTKIKWIKNINGNAKTLKLLEDIRVSLSNLGFVS